MLLHGTLSEAAKENRDFVECSALLEGVVGACDALHRAAEIQAIVPVPRVVFEHAWLVVDEFRVRG
jgi:hypothetical protein